MTPARIGAWLLGLVLPKPLARQFALLGFVLSLAIGGSLGFGAWKLWLHFHDRGVIATRETRVRAEQAEQSLQAEHTATENDAGRRAAASDASAQTTAELETIHAEDPAAAARPASRGTRAVAKRLPVQP